MCVLATAVNVGRYLEPRGEQPRSTVIAGRDPQMERAIAVVIEELQKHRLRQRVVRIVFRPADYPSDEECKLRSAGAQQSSSRRSASVATSAASAQGL